MPPARAPLSCSRCEWYNPLHCLGHTKRAKKCPYYARGDLPPDPGHVPGNLPPPQPAGPAGGRRAVAAAAVGAAAAPLGLDQQPMHPLAGTRLGSRIPGKEAWWHCDAGRNDDHEVTWSNLAEPHPTGHLIAGGKGHDQRHDQWLRPCGRWRP